MEEKNENINHSRRTVDGSKESSEANIPPHPPKENVIGPPPKPGTQFPKKMPTSRKKLRMLLGVAIFFLLLSTLIAVDLFTKGRDQESKITITNYDECANAAGSVIQESYPEVCVTKDGEQFVHEVEIITPTPTPTAETYEFKEYSDENFGITFIYPEDWFEYIESDSIISFTEEDPKQASNLTGITVEKIKNEKDLSLIEFWRNQGQYEISTESYIEDLEENYLEDTIVDSLEALRENPDSAPEGLRTTRVYVLSDSYVYKIRATFKESDTGKDTLFEKILSTVKFE